MAGPFVQTDFEHALQLEGTFNTAPGAPVGADFVRFRTRFPFKRKKARVDRDQDSDNSASVVTTQGGRESSEWELEGDVTPNGNGSTPTKCDADPALEAHFGLSTACTAHTTTAAGSAGTSIVLTPGGGAASGIPTGGNVIIAIDIDGAGAYETRRVISRSTDTLTIDQAFSSDPPTGRTVKVSAATYKYSKAQLKTLHGYTWLSGDNFRQKVGGLIAQMLELGIDASGEAPTATWKFSGPGCQIAPHSTAKPTPVTAGQPLVPTKTKVFVGSTLHCLTKVQFQGDNSIELRESELCDQFPSGVKRTKNNGRWNGRLTLGLLLTTGTVEGYWDNADGLTSYNLNIQIGITPGQILAINIPKFIPDAEVGDVAGEVALELVGRCYDSTTGDDSVFLALI
jgi:hypothetical protein